MAGPKEVNLTAYSDSGLHESVVILDKTRQPKSLEGWQVHASAVVNVLDENEALSIVAEVPNVSTGEIVLEIDAADVKALLGDTLLQKSIPWTLLAKPFGSYTVKLATGELKLVRGGGRW